MTLKLNLDLDIRKVYLCTKNDVSTFTQYGFNLRFWLHCHFSFFDFSFLRTQFGNLKCAIGGEFKFLSNCRFRFGLYNAWNKFTQILHFLKFFLHCILFSLMFMIVLEHNWYLNLQMDRNMNSPPIAHFRFPNCVLRKEKSKKERMAM